MNRNKWRDVSDVPESETGGGVMEWRDISTAPKNGTRVLIWSESPATGHRAVYLAWWAIPYENAPDERGWWECDLWGGHHPVVPEFVHGWMPLPEPPKCDETQK